MPDMTTPSLFGISKSNRDFSDPYYWGKNQFNSAFPVALACYMQSKSVPLVYVKYKSNSNTVISDISVSETFGSNLPSSELYFSFESRFDAFRDHVHDEPPAIDLVVCNGARNQQIRPIEIKLTTLPDNTTEALQDHLYGTELVIRSATTRYLALSIVGNIQRKLGRVREIFEPALATIRDWDNKAEMALAAPKIVAALESFLTEFQKVQAPLLMQPIWKTIGKSPILANHCLDIFVWSDFALCHLFLDSARQSLARTSESGTISRQLRAALRLSRFLYQASLGSKVHQAPIYDGMTYDNQNDKEFAISGTKSHGLMSCARLTKPLITKDEVKNIILGGGHKFLSPEKPSDPDFTASICGSFNHA